MAVVGIDIGTQFSVIAQAVRGGVDIILNESSKRLTP
jgi:molecular chaperone DnaK (HSP70)